MTFSMGSSDAGIPRILTRSGDAHTAEREPRPVLICRCRYVDLLGTGWSSRAQLLGVEPPRLLAEASRDMVEDSPCLRLVAVLLRLPVVPIPLV